MRSNIARFGFVSVMLALGWDATCLTFPASAMSFDGTPVNGTPVYAPRVGGTHVTGTPTTQTPVDGTAVAATPIDGSPFAALSNRWDFDSSHRRLQQISGHPKVQSPCAHTADPTVRVRCDENPASN